MHHLTRVFPCMHSCSELAHKAGMRQARNLFIRAGYNREAAFKLFAESSMLDKTEVVSLTFSVLYFFTYPSLQVLCEVMFYNDEREDGGGSV